MEGLGINERLLAEIVCLDPLKVDGVMGLINLGTKFWQVFYCWQPTHIENGIIVREKIAKLVIERPRESCVQGGRYARVLDAQGQPIAPEAIPQLAMAH